MVFCIKYRKKILFDKDRVEFFKEICFEIGGRYWFEFDAIGTDGDGVTTDIIKRYVETQGTKEEKESCKQMKLLDFK
jgi:putative transposase